MTSKQAEITLERIRQAKRVLEGVKPELFDIGYWTAQSDCGTKHCVGGWLRLDAWFQENTSISNLFNLDYGYVYPTEWSCSHFGGLAPLLADMMQIRTHEAKDLFGLPIDNPNAPETVAEALKYLDGLETSYLKFVGGTHGPEE